MTKNKKGKKETGDPKTKGKNLPQKRTPDAPNRVKGIAKVANKVAKVAECKKRKADESQVKAEGPRMEVGSQTSPT